MRIATRWWRMFHVSGLGLIECLASDGLREKSEIARICGNQWEKSWCAVLSLAFWRERIALREFGTGRVTT
jgi:hypothetical protein